MQEFMGVLSPEHPLSILQIAHKLRKDNSHVRKVLIVMERLGLVRRVNLASHKSTTRGSQAKIGWVIRK
jgi:predicted transcriptional regulator